MADPACVAVSTPVMASGVTTNSCATFCSSVREAAFSAVRSSSVGTAAGLGADGAGVGVGAGSAGCDSRSSRTPPNSLSGDSGASVAAGAEHPAAQQSIIKASAAAAAFFRMVPRSIRLITPLLRNRREREQV